MSDSDRKAAVLAAEDLRCRAIREQDFEALGAVIDDDLTYRHSSGRLEHKDDFINGVAESERWYERGELTVRLFHEVAVVTGDYYICFPPLEGEKDGRRIRADAMQVWIERDDTWRLVAHQGTANPT